MHVCHLYLTEDSSLRSSFVIQYQRRTYFQDMYGTKKSLSVDGHDVVTTSSAPSVGISSTYIRVLHWSNARL